MAFWNFRTKSDTLKVDKDGKTSVDVDALLSKPHVRATVNALRSKDRGQPATGYPSTTIKVNPTRKTVKKPARLQGLEYAER